MLLNYLSSNTRGRGRDRKGIFIRSSSGLKEIAEFIKKYLSFFLPILGKFNAVVLLHFDKIQ